MDDVSLRRHRRRSAAARAARRRRRRRRRPTRSPACARALRPARAVPAVRRHRRAAQEPARPGRGRRDARRAAAAGRRRRRGMGRHRHRRVAAATCASSGFVPSDDLSALYAGADVFCYPSEREGYGLPVLEAMAQGAPVVTSAGTATEETAGSAAVLVDPSDPGRHRPRHRRGDRVAAPSCRRRASPAPHKRSWSQTAALTADAYRELAPMSRRPADVARQPAVVRAGRGRRVRAVPGAPAARAARRAARQPVRRRADALRDAAFATAHPPSWPAVPVRRRARSTARDACRRVVDENTWLRAQTAGARPASTTAAAPRRGGPPSVRADDPRPAVPHVPAVLQPRSKRALPRRGRARLGRGARRSSPCPASTCAAR